MNILGLVIISLFITIIVLAKDEVFRGKIDIAGKLVRALSIKRINILKTKLFVSVLISILVFLTLRTNLFDNFQIYRDLGFSSGEEVITREKRMNSNDEAIHFFLGTLSGYAFDTWIAALAIGCMKEIGDFANHYHHHSISRAQIIHDGIMDPIFWALGGFVGYFSLEEFHIL